MTIQCNASNYGTGGVLLQEGESIAFTSCTLTSTEQNYTVILKKNFMAPFYGWGSTDPRLEPLWGGSLLLKKNA